MKNWIVILSVLFVCSSFEYGLSAEPEHLIWESMYTKTPPTIDGKLDEIWDLAKPLTVMIREAIGGHDPFRVILHALHTDDAFYVFAQWPDSSKSNMRDPYVWNPEVEEYERPSKPDDQFALEFPMSGEFNISMLTTVYEYTADVWHWKAGRGNPVGWVDDKRHIISQKPIEGGRQYNMGGRGKVYIARLMDEGQSSYSLLPEPTEFKGEVVDSFEPRQPSGSLADVRGKGHHDGAKWTLEISRKFTTAHNDDAVIDPNKDNTCAIAVLNDELYWNHAVSPEITLRFVGNAK